jgi:hypothetical protein
MSRYLALMMLLLAGTCAADELGRLFTTPAQRAAMDGANTRTENAPRTLAVMALIQRKGGVPVVVFDAEKVRVGDQTRSGVRVMAADPTGVVLQVPGVPDTVTLKPGAQIVIAREAAL